LLRPKKILYIEDDLESREMMGEILRVHGYEYFAASRGLEGIKVATHELPDLILMDLNLPDMSGFEVTTLLKSVRALKSTPIIALTGESTLKAKDMTITAGCEGFISKPINISEFLQKITEYLEGHKESITPDDERRFLSEYNIRLGERLQSKIEELEKANQNLITINEKLNESKQKLSEYNNRLFTLNTLANTLRTLESPEALLRTLPDHLHEGFHVERVILFRYSQKKQQIQGLYATGISEKKPEKLKFNLDHFFYSQLKNETKLVWIKQKDEILNEALLKLAQKLNSTSFLLGSMAGFSSHKDSTGIFRSISTTEQEDFLKTGGETDNRNIVIFIDRGLSQNPFDTYEVRVLKSFLQTASTIFENMTLYHNLLRMLRIKEQEALTDALTGSYNYRYFQSQIEREILRSKRHNNMFSVAMIDVDNFKEYNDTHGHLNGDIALKRLADVIHENIRKSDILARYGGDEFIIILPELNKPQARALAEKLCQVISRTSLPAKKLARKINLTISLGIATYPVDGETEELLVKKADDALYKAKNSGRNTVCISV